MKKLSYILLCGLMLILSACEKDTESSNFAPVVTTGNADNIYRKGATLTGTIHLTETNTAESYGILLSELESMVEYIEYPVNSYSTGSFDFIIFPQDLEPNKTYYYCAYASSGYSMSKGQIKNFTTTPSNAPMFGEIILLNIDEKSCSVSADIFDDGGSELLMSGFVWKEEGTGEPTIQDNVVNVQGVNSLSTTITGMEPNKSYLIRAYAVNSTGIGYSETINVKTSAATIPILSEITQVDSTEVSITLKANIKDVGSGGINKIGFCYSSESKDPTTAHIVVDLSDQLGAKEFITTIEDLKPETTYYFRAFAENDKGIGYSETISYTTQQIMVLSVNVPEAGGLSNYIDDTAKYNIKRMKISGYLNGDDIRLIREMAGRDVYGNETEGILIDLELSDATIVGGGGAYYITDNNDYICDNSRAKTIVDYMFDSTIIENIVLPTNTIEIMNNAFSECKSLTSIIIPEGTTLIGDGVFSGCSSLASITIPDGVTSIGDAAFSRCSSLETIEIPESISIIESGLFNECKSLTNVILPSTITSIGSFAFWYCTSLKSIIIPEGVTSIGDYAFGSCSNLETINIPNGVTEIPRGLFNDCYSLTSVVIPDGVVSIGDYAFSQCDTFTNIDIPNGVTKIGVAAFYDCSKLTAVIIGNGVQEINEHAFLDCSKLSEVTCNATTPPTLGGTCFQGVASPSNLYVPSGSATAYSESDWAQYFTTIEEK